VRYTRHCSRCLHTWDNLFIGCRLSPMQFLARTLAPLTLLICLSAAELQAAASSTQSRHSTEGQSFRNTANLLTLQAETIALGPDETYRFGVADAKGTIVPIRWSLSEPGCAESNCGIVYDDGLFRAPHSLRKERVVFLVGVPIAEPPLYMIRAEVRLVRRTRVPLTTPASPAPKSTAPLLVRSESSGDYSPGAPPEQVRAALTQAAHAEQRPIVTYNGGLLAIDAEDATLATVLHLIAEKTGAAINLPPGTGNERIVEHAGPGEPRDVLKDFLNGSPFGFIIVNSPDRPHELQQVLLFVKDRSGDPQSVSAIQTDSPILDAADSQNRALGSAASELSPRRPVPPEVIQRMLRAKAREIRERALQEGTQPQ
jgi:hypothetical protein